jgi:hypothetical protein
MQTWMQKAFLAALDRLPGRQTDRGSNPTTAEESTFFSDNILKKSYHQLIAGIFQAKQLP